MSLIRLSLQELKRGYGKLIVPCLCIAVAVASQSAVGFFSAQVDHAMDQEAKAMAGADLEVSSARALTVEELAKARSALPKQGVRTAEVSEFISMAANPIDGRTRLVEVRSVGEGFPFYGGLETDPPLPLARVADTSKTSLPGVFAQSEILPQLGIDRGGVLKLGTQEFRVLTWVKKEPGPGGSDFALGPRIWLSEKFLSATGLAKQGSRVRYRRLFALTPEPTPAALEKLKKVVEKSLDDPTLKVRTFQESNSQLRGFYQRLDEFLSLLTLLVFLLAGVGVMSAIRAHIRTRVASIAILRCFGATRTQVFGMFLFQAFCLGFAGSVLGVTVGAFLSRAIPRLLAGLIVLPPQTGIAWLPSLGGLLSGVAVTLLFSLVSLVELPSIRPALLLRAQPITSAPTRARVIAGFAAFAYFALLAGYQTGSFWDGLKIVGGVVGIAALLYAGFYFSVRWFDRSPHFSQKFLRRLPFSARYGLKNFFRLRGQAALTLSVLGLGVLLLSSVSLIRVGMLDELTGVANPTRPELFMIDVGDDQKVELAHDLEKEGSFRLNWAKLIKARLIAVNGETNLRETENESRSREFNLSERLKLYDTERISGGVFWSSPTTPPASSSPEIDASVESGFAERMKVGVGDRLDFEIQGVPFIVRVKSLREVKWATFEPNFFILLRPGALEGAPFTWIGTLAGAHPPTAKIQVQEMLVKKFPTVTVIDVEEASLRLLRIANRIEAVIRFLSAFALLAGLAVMALIALENSERRAREAALLKVMGGTRSQLIGSVASEFLLIAILTCGSGWAGALLLCRAVLGPRFGIETPWISHELAVIFVVLTVGVVGLGILSSLRAFQIKPIALLKTE